MCIRTSACVPVHTWVFGNKLSGSVLVFKNWHMISTKGSAFLFACHFHKKAGMCNLGFKFPCLFCLQNSNTRYLELRYPQLCSLGRKTARLNLYERSPDCRHYCLYSQRQSTAMVWESTTVKILSPGSFEPLLHANICTHALWRECGTSPWILICLCTSEIQRSELGSGGEEQRSGSHIYLSPISVWFLLCSPTKPKGICSLLSRQSHDSKNVKNGYLGSEIQIHP